MHIGIFSSSIGFGGAQNTAVSMADGLRKRGHRVTLYLDAARFRSHKDIRSFEVCDLPLNGWCPYGLHSLSVMNSLRCVRRLWSDWPDVVLSMSSQPLPLLMLLQAFRQFPVIYYEVGQSRTWASRLFRGSVVANSEETMESLRQYRAKTHEDIPVVRARIDCDAFLPVVTPPGENNTDGAISLLMFSRMEFEKVPAIVRVIAAVSLLLNSGRKVRLALCGPGKDRAAIMDASSRVVDRDGGKCITVAPPTSDPLPLIRNSDIVLGIGRSAWEAMACARPVIVVGKEGLGGIVCEDNLPVLMHHNFTARGTGRSEGERELADLLLRLIDSVSKRRELGQYGYNIVRQYYDVKIGAAQMEGILHRAIENAPSVSLRLRRISCLTIALLTWAQLYLKAVLLWLLKPSLVFHSIVKRRHLASKR